MSKTIVAIFEQRESAERAANAVNEHGLKSSDISIIRLEDTQGGERETTSTTENDNISRGTFTGTSIGGVAGIALGLGTLAIPGLGVIAAAGPVAGLISGAITGGVVGSLVDLGIPQDASNRYEEDIRSGRVYWSMPISEDNGGKVAQILREYGASRIEVHNGSDR